MLVLLVLPVAAAFAWQVSRDLRAIREELRGIREDLVRAQERDSKT